MSSRTNAASAGSAQARPPARTMRIAITYEGESLRVTSRQVVSMRTPPSDPIATPERQAGFWFQVEDISGHPIYRKVMENPVRFDTETPSDDPEKPLRREQLTLSAGTFFLLVPVLPQARTVLIFSSPFTQERSAQPGQEVLRFPLFADVAGGQQPGGGGQQPDSGGQQPDRPTDGDSPEQGPHPPSEQQP